MGTPGLEVGVDEVEYSSEDVRNTAISFIDGYFERQKRHSFRSDDKTNFINDVEGQMLKAIDRLAKVTSGEERKAAVNDRTREIVVKSIDPNDFTGYSKEELLTAYICALYIKKEIIQARSRHSYKPLGPKEGAGAKRVIKRTAERVVKELGSFCFRDSDDVSFRGEVRQTLGAAAKQAFEVGRDPKTHVYMRDITKNYEILGILNVSKGIDSIRKVLKGLYAGRSEKESVVIVQVDATDMGGLNYNTYFKKRDTDSSMDFGKPVAQKVKASELDDKMRQHNKVRAEGTMAIAVSNIQEGEIEFDVYIVESERLDQCRGASSTSNAG